MKKSEPKSYVVVEGQLDAELLATLFAQTPDIDTKVLPAQEWSSALFLARTLLLSKNIPLVLVLGADEAKAADVQKVVADGLAQVAPQSRWRVHTFDPDIETELLVGASVDELRSANSKAKRRALASEKLQSPEFVAHLRRQPKLKSTLDFIATPQFKAVS